MTELTMRRNSITTVLVLGLLLVTLFAPFSALALLMLFIFVSVVGSMVWTLVRTLVQGDA
ncbi:hypothetical protein [Trichocoleus desertorum]